MKTAYILFGFKSVLAKCARILIDERLLSIFIDPKGFCILCTDCDALEFQLLLHTTSSIFLKFDCFGGFSFFSICKIRKDLILVLVQIPCILYGFIDFS